MSNRTRALRVFVSALALSAAVAGLAPAEAFAGSLTCTVSPQDQANDAEEQQFLQLLNQYRVENGRNPVAFHPDLTRAAAWFSRDMATDNYFPPDHVDDNGRNIPTRLTWCGVSYTAWGENIYAHTANFDAESAFAAWRNSPTHNHIMLLPDITSVGVARAFDASSQYDWYWTLDVSNTPPYRDPAADFDNNRSTDVSVFRPTGNTWFVRNGTSVSFGAAGDIPVPADYDGSGSTDIAVFRPTNGYWFVRDGVTAQFGASGDVPVPGDYNGDGITDIAVFRPASGYWFVRNGLTVQFGASGDIPVPGDYDGNGTTDIAVFRPANGYWFVRNGATVQFGASGDIPLPLAAAIRRAAFP